MSVQRESVCGTKERNEQVIYIRGSNAAAAIIQSIYIHNLQRYLCVRIVSRSQRCLHCNSRVTWKGEGKENNELNHLSGKFYKETLSFPICLTSLHKLEGPLCDTHQSQERGVSRKGTMKFDILTMKTSVGRVGLYSKNKEHNDVSTGCRAKWGHQSGKETIDIDID